MVVRGNLKARRAFSERVDSKTNVKWVWDSEVEEVLGGDAVTGLRPEVQDEIEGLDLSMHGEEGYSFEA